LLLDEPPPSQGDLRFSLLGVPVRVSPLFWIVSVMLGLGATGGQVTAIAIWTGAAFVSILVHEMGHALAAKSYGWPPSVMLHGLGGLTMYRPTYHDARSRIAITLAGPMAGFALAALTILALQASGHDVTLTWSRYSLVDFDRLPYRAANILVVFLLYINIFWGLINLLPVLPLDGGQIARELIGLVTHDGGVRQALWLSIAMAVVVGVFAWLYVDTYLGLLFGYLAYQNYATLSTFGSSGGWR